MRCVMPHPGSAGSGNDNRPNIVNVGQRRAGDRQIPLGGKKTIANRRPGLPLAAMWVKETRHDVRAAMLRVLASHPELYAETGDGG
ncbi:hypothetical protein EDF73_11075 [Raoultella sp. BIGb0138]|nr:hypothetical protein EDF73_11075 [Raoultella sp. BIGb0138]